MNKNQKIPKVIHYCWFGNELIPEEHKKYMESWRRFCPDYEIIKWNESNYDITQIAYMLDAYKAKYWAFVSDFARLDIVYQHGGIYLDTDVELVKSLDDLLDNDAFVGLQDGNMIATGLGFGAIRGHSAIQELRNEYFDLSFINSNGSFNVTPCPKLQTRHLLKKGFIKKNCKQVVNGITIYPTEYFSPLSHNTYRLNITPNTYSIHHYNSSWLSDADKEKIKIELRLQKYVGQKLAKIIAIYKCFGLKKLKYDLREHFFKWR